MQERGRGDTGWSAVLGRQRGWGARALVDSGISLGDAGSPGATGLGPQGLSDVSEQPA